MIDDGLYFKLLAKDRTGGFSQWRWPVPRAVLPPVEGNLRACHNGYHMLTRHMVTEWWIQNSCSPCVPFRSIVLVEADAREPVFGWKLFVAHKDNIPVVVRTGTVLAEIKIPHGKLKPHWVLEDYDACDKIMMSLLDTLLSLRWPSAQKLITR